METILLDTITFDYLLHSPANLSRKAADAINKAGVLFVSVVSLWEMTSHIRTGKITINAPFDRMLLAHALALHVPIVSPDQLFPHYEPLGLQLVW